MVSSGVLGGELSQFFEVGEIVFDGVEVGAVGWEEQHMVPLLGGAGLKNVLFVERGVVPYDRRIGRSSLHNLSRGQVLTSSACAVP